MGGNSVGPVEIFQLLESNKSSDVEEIKQIFHDQFLLTKDNCLVNGLFDYFLSTKSIRAIEVLSSVREPHDKHLLDRLLELLAKPASSNQRVQAVSALGHIARRQPTWIYKLTSHSFFKELLKLLKLESDPIFIVSALLLLVTLIPMIPAALGPHLTEIFDVFIHLAYYHHLQSSNVSTNVSNVMGNQFHLPHLQMALYTLYHRLFAMYPCSLVAFLRQQYNSRDNEATYKHTILPMLDTVRMHPLLITTSRDAETNPSRWKKMEHHDVVAECGHFVLDRSREEYFTPINSRVTPLLDHQGLHTPVSMAEGLLGSAANDRDDDIFWSPSMSIPPQSPKTIPPSHEPRSTPSTPNNNNANSNSRSNSSPPEAAIEATPETTPVKELRQISRQTSISSAARALSAFGNGSLTGNSRPSTPNSNMNTSAFAVVNNSESGIVSQKMNRIFADRNYIMQAHAVLNFESVDKIADISNQNGKNDSWNEDQEVSEIVSSHKTQVNHIQRLEMHQERTQRSQKNLLHQFKMLRVDSTDQSPVSLTPVALLDQKVQRSKSCSNLDAEPENPDLPSNDTKEACTQTEKIQTQDLFPYEHMLSGILEQKTEQQGLKNNLDSRLSPTLMLDRYIEACARLNANDLFDKKLRSKKRGSEDDGSEGLTDETELDPANQHLQLMQMQLLFERQRREVHAERNRRLVGKLRNSRALEEQNNALGGRLRMSEREVVGLKSEIERSKREGKVLEERSNEALQHWQQRCLEEQHTNRLLKERVELLELELKKEKKKSCQQEQQAREAEAALFDAGHQLKEALKAANHGERLEKVLDNVQKKFFLFGESQSRCLQRFSAPVPMIRQEAAQIQKSYAEELANLQRQVDSRKSTIEALRTRLVELEKRETELEIHLVDQQRLLQEAQERNDAELRAVESKYKAQVSINQMLESRILELHGNLEDIKSRLGSNVSNFSFSESPKEQSPPLSGSFASSGDGSLAFHSATGIINDYNDSAGEISNLQAIVEPSASTSSQATTPVRRQ